MNHVTAMIILLQMVLTSMEFDRPNIPVTNVTLTFTIVTTKLQKLGYLSFFF